MNSISFNTSFTHLLLLKIALVVSITTAIAGEGNIEPNRFTEVDTSSAQMNKSWYNRYQQALYLHNLSHPTP
jgi:hypothetical protein